LGIVVTGKRATADSLIKSVLSLRGRVQPADLGALDEAEREQAIRAYFDAHHDAEALRFEGDTLVAEAKDAGDTEIDQLLGGYEGVEDVEALPQAAVTTFEEAGGIRGEAENRTAARPSIKEQGIPDASSPTDGDTSLKSRLWLLWWAPSVLVPLIGGSLAWLLLRHEHEKAARAMLGVGLATGMIGSLLFLKYAAEIAGFVQGTSRGQVIKMPPASSNGAHPAGSTTAPGGAGTTSEGQ
jgi:hypothetical protein